MPVRVKQYCREEGLILDYAAAVVYDKIFCFQRTDNFDFFNFYLEVYINEPNMALCSLECSLNFENSRNYSKKLRNNKAAFQRLKVETHDHILRRIIIYDTTVRVTHYCR